MTEILQLLQQKTKSSPWKFRQIRKIVTGAEPKFGITVPRNIAYQFLEVKFTIKTSGNSIVLTASGTGV